MVTECGDVSIHLTGSIAMAIFCEHCNECSSSIKGWEFLVHPSDYQIFKNGCASRTCLWFLDVIFIIVIREYFLNNLWLSFSDNAGDLIWGLFFCLQASEFARALNT
jgi:hypothetical protein